MSLTMRVGCVILRNYTTLSSGHEFERIRAEVFIGAMFESLFGMIDRRVYLYGQTILERFNSGTNAKREIIHRWISIMIISHSRVDFKATGIPIMNKIQMLGINENFISESKFALYLFAFNEEV